MKIQILMFAVVMVFYAQWKFASPFLPNPTLRHNHAMMRHAPLILWIVAGLLLSFAFPNFGHNAFVAALFVSGTMIFTGLALAYRYGQRE